MPLKLETIPGLANENYESWAPSTDTDDDEKGHCVSRMKAALDNVKDDGHLDEMRALQHQKPLLFPTAIHFQSIELVHQRAQFDSQHQRLVPSSPSVSIDCLTARLSIFVREVFEYAKTQPKTNTDGFGGTGGDAIRATLAESMVIEGLRSVQWGLKRLRLVPPSAQYSAIGSHTFWLAIPPMGLVMADDGRARPLFVLDFRFGDLFAIARPTALYQHFLHAVRHDFVGTVPDLQKAIEAFASWASQSLGARHMEVAPWRRASFLESCFALAIQQSTQTVFIEQKARVDFPARMRRFPTFSTRVSSLSVSDEVGTKSKTLLSSWCPEASPHMSFASPRLCAEDFNFEKVEVCCPASSNGLPSDNAAQAPSGLACLMSNRKI